MITERTPSGQAFVPCSAAVDEIVRHSTWTDSQGVRRRFSFTAAAVLNRILGCTRRGGCYPSHATLAGVLGLHPSTVRNWIRRLESAGLLDRWARYRRGRQTSNEYRAGAFLVAQARRLSSGLRVRPVAQRKQRHEQIRRGSRSWGFQGQRASTLQAMADLIGIPSSARNFRGNRFGTPTTDKETIF